MQTIKKLFLLSSLVLLFNQNTLAMDTANIKEGGCIGSLKLSPEIEWFIKTFILDSETTTELQEKITKVAGKACSSLPSKATKLARWVAGNEVRPVFKYMDDCMSWIISNKIPVAFGAAGLYYAYYIYNHHRRIVANNQNFAFDQELNGIYTTEVSNAAHRVIDYLKNPQNYPGMPKTLLLIGPPGTGKTELAKAISQAGNREFHEGDVNALRGNGNHNNGPLAIRGLFLRAAQNANANNPVVVFIDEINQIVPDRNGPAIHEQDSSLTTALIRVMNNFDNGNVFLIATTNTYHTMDPAIKDRFGVNTLRVELPTAAQRQSIISHYLNLWLQTPAPNQNKAIQPNLEEYITKISDGGSGRWLKILINAAGLGALIEAQQANPQGNFNVCIRKEHVEAALKQAEKIQKPCNILSAKNFNMACMGISTTYTAIQLGMLIKHLVSSELSTMDQCKQFGIWALRTGGSAVVTALIYKLIGK